MFYQKDLDQALRFGDVISGFISSIPKMKEPVMDHRHPEYNLELSLPDFCVVLSPCCSIGDSTLTLVKLEPVINKFFANPYFESDLTNINRPVPPEYSVPPQTWEEFSEEEREKRRKEGLGFVFFEYFIYQGNESFLPYKLRFRGNEFETRFYMIDFRKSFRIHCTKVVNPQNSPLEVKFLQLSVYTRQELRDKISKYFSRQPLEDATLFRAA